MLVQPVELEALATRGTLISDVIKRTNKSSQNFMAEALDKLCGEALRRAEGGKMPGTSWEAGTAEAQAVVAAASGDLPTARERMQSAVEQFQRAGQPLDAQRCCRALADY